MLTFKKVILHNFGSYNHAELNLDARGICLVSGINNCQTDNALSNGSGKSQLWNAICFALTGQTASGIKSNLKNIYAGAKDESYVQLYFFEQNNSYIITRYLSPKSDLKIIRNDIDVSGKGIKESSKKLDELLPDLTIDLISSIIIIGQGMPNAFSKHTPSGRKEILEKLTKSYVLFDNIKQCVSDRAVELQTSLNKLTYNNNLLAVEKSGYEQNIQKLNNQLLELSNNNYAEQLKAQQVLLDEAKTKKSEAQAQLDKINTEITDKLNRQANIKYSEQLEKSKLTEAYYIKTVDIDKEKNDISTNISILQSEIKKLESIVDTCPLCHQKLPDVHRHDTTEQHKQLDVLQEKLKLVNDQISAEKSSYNESTQKVTDTYKLELTELTSKLTNLNTIKSELTRAINTSDMAIQQYTNSVATLTANIENCKQNKVNLQKEISNLSNKIFQLSDEIKTNDDAINNTSAHLGVVRQIQTVTSRDFRGYLLSNIIKSLNIIAKQYCQTVFNNDRLDIVLNGNDLDIIYCDKSFDNLSGGEKQRIDLILQLSLRYLLIKYFNFDSNILVLDEITDFLDKQSCKAIMKLVSEELTTVESLFIVSHHATDLDISIDSEIHVIKNEHGISSLTY